MTDAGSFQSCAICGRTILRGEQVSEYVDDRGEPAPVCALCKSRAEAAGWLPAEHAQASAPAAPQSRRTRAAAALRERLARARAQADARPAAELAEEPVPAPPGPPADTEPEASPDPPPPDPVEPPPAPADEPHLAPAPGGRGPLGAAVATFNASEERRKVAGLTRSLGAPQARVGAGEDGGATIVIAWDLSWYRWAVRDGRVSELAKGSELDELDAAEREWNARVADDGTLALD